MTTVTSRDIQDRIDHAAKPYSDGVIELPSGEIELDTTLDVKAGVQLIGRGSHASSSQPGTTLVPSPSMTGPLIHTLTDFWHHGAIRNLRVHGGPSHGIEVVRGMGENAIIDNVAAYENAGDGILIGGDSTPCQIGRVSVHGNAFAGLRLFRQMHTLVQVQYLAGDNNGESLLTVNGGSPATNIQILAWKAERWGPNPGHPDVIRLHNLNGGVVDLGQGRVHIGSGISDAPGAIIRQTADEGSSIGYVNALVTLHTASGSYASGYKDEKVGIDISVSDFVRTRFSTIKPWHWHPWELQMRLGQDVFWKSGSANPEGTATAGPGSIYSRTNGEFYVKEAGTDNIGWRRVELSG